jgi:hypothetical protein
VKDGGEWGMAIIMIGGGDGKLMVFYRLPIMMGGTDFPSKTNCSISYEQLYSVIHNKLIMVIEPHPITNHPP